MKKILFLPMLLGLIACNGEYSGSMSLDDDLSIKTRSFFNQGRTHTIAAGSYSGRARMGSRNMRLYFNNKVTTEEGREIDHVRIKIQKSGRDKLGQNSFILTKNDIRQDFAVKVGKSYEEERSSSESAYESCTYITYEYRCWEECKTEVISEDGATETKCYTQCGDVPVTNTGSHYVEYYYLYQTWNIDLELVDDESSEESMGTFEGSKHDTDKIYTHTGTCS